MARFSNKMSSEALLYYNNYYKNKDKQKIDWRDPELRSELFNRYAKWRTLTHDLDHSYYSRVLCDGYDYEQKAWFAFAFGQTYRTPQAFVYSETFPRLETTAKELEEWNKENWERTTYGTDARYNKGFFAKQSISVLEWLGGDSFEKKLSGILVHDTQKENFYALYKEVTSLYKYGRMTGWLTMQGLHDVLDLPIDPEQIMLDGYNPNKDSSLKSIWNGLMMYHNTPEKCVGGKYGEYTVTQHDTDWADEELLKLTSMAESTGGFKMDSFKKESIWCQFKRLFREENSVEYPGHASGDAASRYPYYKNKFPEYDWHKFRKALREQPSMMAGKNFVDWHNGIFGKTGGMLNMHEMFDDMDNMYELMEMPEDFAIIPELWTDDGLPAPSILSKPSTLEEFL